MTKGIQLDTTDISVKGREGVAARILLTWMASVGMSMGFYSEFHIDVSTVFIIAVCAVVSILLQILFTGKKTALIGGGIFVFAVAGVSLAMVQSVSNGFAIIANELLTTVNKNMAMANLMFVAYEDESGVDMLMASGILTIAVTFVLACLIRLRLNILASILVFAGVVVGMLYHDSGSPLWIVIGLGAVFGIMLMGSVRGRITADMYVRIGISVCAVCVVTALIYAFVSYSSLPAVDSLKNSIVYHGGNVIYGKSDYPEGEFERFDDVTVTGEDRLKVTTDKPVRLYLRGYVASKYTDEGWEENDQDIYGGDYSGVFDWFLKNQYSPLTNLSAYIEESRAQDENIVSSDRIVVSIDNVGARKKYQYIPESVTYGSLSGLYAAKNDVNFIAQGINTETQYSFEIDEVPDGSYRSLYGAEWYKNQTGDESFLNSENVYGTFARTFYMDVPDETADYFSQHLEYAGETLNPFDALSVVRDYLAADIEYNEEADGVSANGDFVVNLLDETKEGYSVHYATAAVLMFRYYGIPARYVEGYLAEPADEAGETVTLTDGDAHAWAEVYISGLGFVPFEVTPGFYEDDEEGGGGGGGGSSAGGQMNIPPENDNEDLQDDEHPVVNVTWILYVAVGVLILFIVLVLVRRAVICSRRKRGMYSTDPAVAIAASSTLMEKLAAYQSSKLEACITDDIKEILLRYKFSNMAPDEAEAAVVRDAAIAMCSQVYSASKVKGKLYLRFVVCLK